tara:strand:- start:390 stop:2213 length:1824 start_codon:yes stop_codon:yes gene_type:complete
MKQILLLVLLIPTIILAEEVTTSNLISQKFTDSTWSGTNQYSRHGTGTIAGVDGKYVVHDDISLLNDANMNESQIQNGWSSTLGAQIWSWNNNDQVTTMKQTITDNLGNVSTQIRNISTTSSNSYTSYTDKHTQGTNSATDFDISVRFDFDESSNNSGHRATDLRQPTLILTYEQTPIAVSETTIEELQAVDTQIESVIQMLDKQEIGGTTFTQMVENIIIDSGLDMELTFAEPDMEMEMYLDETVQIDSLEQTIDDEMAGVVVLEAPIEMDEPTVDMPVMTDMDMPEPTFTEMAVESFETMTESFSQMFDMEIPADMSTEDATVIMDAMVEMDMPMEMEKPAMEVTDEVPTMEVTDEMTTMEEPVETVAMNDEPTSEPTMDEPREMEMEEDAPVPTEMNEPTSEPTMDEPREETPTTEEPVEDEAPVTEEPEPTENETPEPTENDTSTTSEPTPTEDTETVETAEETTVAEVDDDSEVSSTSVSTTVEVETIGKKIEKIIAKVNARLKKVSDRVRAIQVVTLKGMQMDGPQLTSYQQSAFYEPTQMYGGNPDFFQDINILEQQQIYADSRLAYSDNDPIAIQQSILRDINIQKNKILSEIRELRGK